jgi:hypothetical protein
VPLVVVSDDLDIEAAIRTVGSRDPVRVEVLDAACFVARSWHAVVVAENWVAKRLTLAWASVPE